MTVRTASLMDSPRGATRWDGEAMAISIQGGIGSSAGPGGCRSYFVCMDATQPPRQAQADPNSALSTADRKRSVRCLINEFDMPLGPDDLRWNAAGFSRHSDPVAQPPFSQSTLNSAGSGATDFTWKRGNRATRYRIFIKGLTVDADFRQIATVKELSHLGNTFTSGSTIEAHVIAANEAGEAPATEAGSVVVG